MVDKSFSFLDTKILDIAPVETTQKAFVSAAFNPSMFQFQPAPATPAAPSTPVEPVSEPTFAKASSKFGVMRHIDPVRDQFINARLALEDLRLFATRSPGTGKPLLERVEAYLQKHMAADYEKLLTELGVTLGTSVGTNITDKLHARFFAKALPRLGNKDTISLENFVNPSIDLGEMVKDVAFTHNTHSALFATGSVMSHDIRTIESLRQALVKVRRYQQLALENQQAQLAELEIRIQKERSSLNVLEAKRSETLDDYAVAQRLMAEHWQEVEQAYAERKRIIDSNLGLYYVRVRETPMSRTLPDPLDLRYSNADDLVPGCPNQILPLSEELSPFMELLLDIPAADWNLLHGLAHQLPGRFQLEQLVLKSRQRMESKIQNPPLLPVSTPVLNAILQTHQTMRMTITAKPFVVAGLKDMQQQSHQILSLEDLLASANPVLREPANQLHQRLNSAAGCLLERLRAIRPSLRLTWADKAEANSLPVEKPEQWPGLDKAETDDFNNIRTLIDLIGWWFGQLQADASGSSRTAMQNFIRAALLLAAADHPLDLLQGQLKVLPTKFRIGELLRLDLNREPLSGNLLHLLDAQQQVIATVKVEDHDSKGTLASITSILNPAAMLALDMRVTGQRK